MDTRIETTQREAKPEASLYEGKEIIFQDKAFNITPLIPKEGFINLTNQSIIWMEGDVQDSISIPISDIKKITTPAALGNAWGKARLDIKTNDGKLLSILMSKTSKGKARDKVKLIKDYVLDFQNSK